MNEADRLNKKKRKQLKLWIRSKGICHACKKPVYISKIPRTRIPNIGQRHGEVHHIIPRCNGGTDADRNLMLLCNHCHDVLHDKYTVQSAVYIKNNWKSVQGLA
jgi:5-methylcytosine-specific restriction endonuclease McrA